MSIKQVANGTYMVRVAKRHARSKEPMGLMRTGIKSHSEALRVEKELLIKLGQRIQEKLTPSYENVVQEFLNHRRSMGSHPHTIESYEKSLMAHSAVLWAGQRIDKISTTDVVSLIKGTLGDKKQATQKTNLKYVRAVFDFALAQGYILRTPVPKMQFHISDTLKGVLTENQVKVFLARAREVNSHWYPVWLVAVYTGMRSGELYALRWSKIDFDNQLIKVDEAWCSKLGFKTTKSGHARWVEIAPALLTFLEELKLETGETGFVLPRITEWERGLQARELALFLQGIGYAPVRFHDLRATWATVLLNKGIAPIKVMIAGGWRNLKTMQEYIRKAGVDVKGVCATLELHSQKAPEGKLIAVRFGNVVDS